MVRRYGVAVLSTGLALLLTLLLAPWLDLPVSPLFFAAVAVSAWYGGFGPGLCAALLSTLETPPGIPVATVGFNDVENAACLAAQILGVKDRRVRKILEEYRARLRSEAYEKARRVEEAARQIMSREVPENGN